MNARPGLHPSPRPTEASYFAKTTFEVEIDFLPFFGVKVHLTASEIALPLWLRRYFLPDLVKLILNVLAPFLADPDPISDLAALTAHETLAYGAVFAADPATMR